MISKLYIFIISLFSVNYLLCQNIDMYFPHFEGCNYDFILFKGRQTIVIKDTIPAGGRFTLMIPKELTPYTGMCRWLITDTKEGGGLDMIIEGKDFSVTCNEQKPSNENIIYTNNQEVNILNKLYDEQQKILTKYKAMSDAINSFDKSYIHYKLFEQEYIKQLNDYKSFQIGLINSHNYSSKFLNFTNIINGISVGSKINSLDKNNLYEIENFIVNDLEWDDLYTSGHWSVLISIWLSNYIKNNDHYPNLDNDIIKIRKRIRNSKVISDFTIDVLREKKLQSGEI